MSKWYIVCLCPPQKAHGDFFQLYWDSSVRGAKVWDTREEAEKFMREREKQYPHMHYMVVNEDDLNQPHGA